MPLDSGDLESNIEEARQNEPRRLENNSRIPRLTPQELRELARILHEMLRRDIMLERDRMGR